MATILCVGTVGPQNPTRATLPFASALMAIEAGHEPQIALMGEATRLMVDAVARQVRCVEWPPLTDLIDQVVAHHVAIYLCEQCAGRRGVSGDDLVTKNARFAHPKVLLELRIATDKLLVF